MARRSAVLAIVLPLVVALILIAISTAMPETLLFANMDTAEREVTFVLEIYGLFNGQVFVSGSTDLTWTDPYFSGSSWLIDTEIISMNLTSGSDPIPELGSIEILQNPVNPSTGQSISQSPSNDFPADSFFDIYSRIVLPDMFPGDTLYTDMPVYVESVIEQMPPYFEIYQTLPGETILLYNSLGDAAGYITAWSEEWIPYAEPEAFIFVERNGDVAVAHGDTIRFQAGLTGYLEPDFARFRLRPSGSIDPFVAFDFDFDGSEPAFSTILSIGAGDGWSGYLDISAFSTIGDFYEVEACLQIPGFPWLCDTMDIYIDPTPPTPDIISLAEDSLGAFEADTTFDIIMSTSDEDVDEFLLRMFRIEPDYERVLEEIDQLGLGLKDKNGELADSMACCPTATASCLKYWAKNGYKKLEHVKGDTTKPAMSGEDVAKELGKNMGTDAKKGTTTSQAVAGIKKYLKEHGVGDDWKVEYHEEKNSNRTMSKILDEFQAEKEDVIPLLYDVTASGDTVGHFVTLGSTGSAIRDHVDGGTGIHVMTLESMIDFTDPWGGGSTADNEYNIEVSPDGKKASVKGYNLDNDPPDAWVKGFVKVSPPDNQGESGSSAGRNTSIDAGTGAAPRPRARSADTIDYGEWVIVDSKPATGSGIPDTLILDTSGYGGGAYLIEAVLVSVSGLVTRDLRIGGIPTSATGVDDPVPSIKTRLLPNYPNPFNPTTTIRYVLPERGRAHLAVYNVKGVLVSVLVDEERDPGVHELHWNGLSRTGERVASGVYFLRLVFAGQVETRKIVLLK